MSPTSHLPEWDLLRKQVADLARDLAERDRVLHERTRHLHVAQALAHLGSWDWDIANGAVHWSDELYRIFGYEPQSREVTFDTFVSAILPDDHDRVLASFDGALAGASTYDIECRIVRPDGEIRTIHCCGEVDCDGGGQPLRLSGTALDVTDRKRAESALQQREAHFRALIEHSSDIITVLDLDGTIRFESPSFERLLGYAQHELDGRIAFEFVHREDLSVVMEKFQLLIRQLGIPQIAEFRFRHKDGSWRNFEGIGRAVCDPEGRCSVIVNSRDITERKRTEAMLRTSQEKLRQALHASGTGLWDWNTDTKEVVLSEEWKRQLGYEETELADSFETWETRLHPDDHDRAIAYVQDYLTSTESDYRQEFRMRHKDGTYRWIESRASFVIEADGRRIRLLGSHTDVTDRKRMEETLSIALHDLQNITETVPDIMYTLDLEGKVVNWNKHVWNISGYSPEELMHRPALAFVPEDERPKLAAAMQQVVEAGTAEVECHLVTKDGRTIPYHWTGAVLKDRSGRLIGMTGIGRDITALKHVEAAVRESEERYRTLVELSPSGVFVFCEGRTVYINRTGIFIIGGRDPKEILDRSIFEFIHPDYHQEVRENITRLLAGGVSVHSAERTYRKIDGTSVPVQVEAARIMWNGKPAILGLFSDITERKRAEERLRQTQFAMDQAVDAIYWIDPHAKILYANEAASLMMGYSKDELLGMTVHDLNPDFPVSMWPGFWEETRRNRTMSFETNHRAKDGRLVPIDIRVSFLAYEGQEFHCAFVRDITQRKRAEEALRVSEELGRGILNSLSAHIAVLNHKGAIVAVNEAWRRFASANGTVPSLNTGIGMNYLRICRQALKEDVSTQMILDGIEEVRTGRQGAFTIEYPCHSPTEQRWFVLRATALAGDGEGVVVAHEDITDRKRAEEALRASEERFRLLVEEAPLGITVLDGEKRYVKVNQAFCKLVGFSSEELLGQTYARFTHPDDLSKNLALTDEMHAGLRQGYRIEKRYVRKDGQAVWVVVNATRLTLAGATDHFMVAIIEDITERKRVEEALRLTQFSVDRAVEAVLWVDSSARILSVNDTACRMLEYPREKLIVMTVQDIDPSVPVERWQDHWNNLKQQGSLTFESTYRSRTGSVLDAEVTVNYLQYAGKEYGCAILRDVGDRKRAEEELHRSHTFLRQVIDTDPDLIFAKDREGRFTMANKAVADWYGTTVEGLIGKSDAAFNSNAEEVEFFRQNDLEVMNSGRDRFIPEERITDASGRTRWVQTVKRPIFDDHGRAHMVLGAATDITERKRMEEMLLQRERDLSAALQERERISQDLHDGLLQSLYAVGLGLETCKPMIRQHPEPVAGKFIRTLDQAIGQLNQVMGEVRNFIAGLESHVIQGGDFPTALRTMVKSMAGSSAARCMVRIDNAAARRLSTEHALHIINIVREGLSNALRHSQATRITVSFRELSRSVRLAITDDGVGFNARSAQGIGYGLANMAARAQKVRGSFALQSKPFKGTKILLDISKDAHYAHN